MTHPAILRQGDDVEDSGLILTKRQKNPRFDRHLEFAKTCSTDMLIDLIRIQVAILTRLGDEEILTSSTRSGDIENLETLNREALESIFTRLTIRTPR